VEEVFQRYVACVPYLGKALGSSFYRRKEKAQLYMSCSYVLTWTTVMCPSPVEAWPAALSRVEVEHCRGVAGGTVVEVARLAALESKPTTP
jgi:hypothetical protein